MDRDEQSSSRVCAPTTTHVSNVRYNITARNAGYCNVRIAAWDGGDSCPMVNWSEAGIA